MQKYAGFTYIEITVVLAIFTIASFMLVPLAFNQLRANRVAEYAMDSSSWLFASQQNSLTQMSGSAHGLRFTTNSYDVFQGASFATAVDTISVSMINDVTVSAVDLVLVGTSTPTNEVVFQRGKFKPSAHGTITFTDGLISYRVTINIEGLIYYQKL